MLEKAGIGKAARQVSFEGMDRPVLPGTPEFVKALDAAHAMDGEVMLAYAMNGADLPLLNGYPVRLVVPGHYGTYWVKHLADITVLDKEFDGYWMQKAYRIPDNDCACTPMGKAPEKTRPIGRYNVRSFITSLADGARVSLGQAQRARHRLRRRARHPRGAVLGRRRQDLARRPAGPGPGALLLPRMAGGLQAGTGRRLRAEGPRHQHGRRDPAAGGAVEPAGYMRNVVETLRVTAA